MDIQNAYDFYLNLAESKKPQLDVIAEILSKHLEFDKIEAIETGASQDLMDGCFGAFICKLALNYNGSFSSVDIDENISKKSQELFSQLFGESSVSHHVGDSVGFLKNYTGSPNLVHLDSWDLDVKNPVPAMLHGWLEFDAVKEKMPSGSICIIDDNFMKDTRVYWNWFDGFGNYLSTEEVVIEYEIVGKGSMVYHWAQKHDTDWDVIGDHYLPENGNIKLVVKKR